MFSLFTLNIAFAQPSQDPQLQIDNLQLTSVVGSENFEISINDIFNNQLDFGNCCNMLSNNSSNGNEGGNSLCYCFQEVVEEINISPVFHVLTLSDPNNNGFHTYVANNHIYDDVFQKQIATFVNTKISQYMSANGIKTCSLRSIIVQFDNCACLDAFDQIIYKIKIKYCKEIPCPVPCDSY